MGLRSGEFPGHGPKILMFCSPRHLVITFALWKGAPSYKPNCSWMVGRSCSWKMFLNHSLFVAVFLGKIVKRVHSLEFLGCYTVGMTHHLSSPGQAFFRCRHTKGDSSVKMTLPPSSAVQSLYLLQNFCLSLMFFLDKGGFFAALTDARPPWCKLAS